jgi:hypothetical protein
VVITDKCIAMKELDLSGEEGITGSLDLTNVPSLQFLYIGYSYIKNIVFNEARENVKIEEIHANGCFYLETNDFSGLDYLKIYRGNKAPWGYLPDAPNIEVMKFNGCGNLLELDLRELTKSMDNDIPRQDLELEINECDNLMLLDVFRTIKAPINLEILFNSLPDRIIETGTTGYSGYGYINYYLDHNGNKKYADKSYETLINQGTFLNKNWKVMPDLSTYAGVFVEDFDITKLVAFGGKPPGPNVAGYKFIIKENGIKDINLGPVSGYTLNNIIQITTGNTWNLISE